MSDRGTRSWNAPDAGSAAVEPLLALLLVLPPAALAVLSTPWLLPFPSPPVPPPLPPPPPPPPLLLLLLVLLLRPLMSPGSSRVM